MKLSLKVVFFSIDFFFRKYLLNFSWVLSKLMLNMKSRMFLLLIFFDSFLSTAVLPTHTFLLTFDKSSDSCKIWHFIIFDSISISMITKSWISMRIKQRRTILRLISVIVCIFIAFSDFDVFNLEIFFVNFEQLNKILGVVRISLRFFY